MAHIFKHEWKCIALLTAFFVGAGLFVATAIHPPWNESVLNAVAEQPQTMRPQTAKHVALK